RRWSPQVDGGRGRWLVMEPATALEPARRAGAAGGAGALAVAAEDIELRARIVSILREEDLVAHGSAGPVQGQLRTCLQAPIDALVYAGELTAEVARATLAARQRRPGLRVVLVCRTGRAGLKARHALGYGVDGVVEVADIDTALGSTVRAVLAGQAVTPGSQAADLIAPVLSHREKQVLSLVAVGLGNAQIAQRLFLARSTV